jgi:hypothetical protein
MTWAEGSSRCERGLGADLDWPSEEEPRPANGSGGAVRSPGDDDSPARGYFLGQPPGAETEEVPATGTARRSPKDLAGVLREGALQFESLVGSCQAELQDTVAAHVSDLEQALASGTEELNRAAEQRIAALEEAVDARLAEMQRGAVNERIAQLATRLASLGRLAVVAMVLSILALGVAVAALAVAAA